MVLQSAECISGLSQLITALWLMNSTVPPHTLYFLLQMEKLPEHSEVQRGKLLVFLGQGSKYFLPYYNHRTFPKSVLLKHLRSADCFITEEKMNKTVFSFNAFEET